MSEYQYYEFYAVDKPLNKDEIATINSFSSRCRATSRRAAFEYSYGDFPKNGKEVLKRYFDMMVYLSNWGHYQLLMRFPVGTVSFDQLKAFNLDVSDGYTNEITVSKDENHVLLCIEYSDEDPPGWIEGDDLMERLLPIRDQVIAGDYKGLYLIWVHMVLQNRADHAKDWPSTPDNLKDLDDSHDCLIEWLQMDKDMISGLQSQSMATKAPTIPELKEQIEKLTTQEKEAFLVKVLDHEPALAAQLKKRLLDLGNFGESQKAKAPMGLEELEAVTQKQKLLREEKEKQLEKEAWVQKMKKIGRDQGHLWQDVFKNTSLKLSRGYDEAASALKDLKDYHAFEGQEALFEEKLKNVLDQYGKSVAFRRRLAANGVIPGV